MRQPHLAHKDRSAQEARLAQETTLKANYHMQARTLQLTAWSLNLARHTRLTRAS